MKKYKIFGYIGVFISIVLLMVGRSFGDDKKTWLFIGLAAITGVISMILLTVHEKKQKQSETQSKEQASAVSKEQVELHYKDSAINEIVYEYEYGGLNPLREAISRSSCNVEAGYDREEDYFYFALAKLDVGFMKVKLPFLLRLIKSKDREFLAVNEEETDVSELSKEEIVAKIVEAISAENAKEAGDPIDFEITNPKPVLYVWSVLLAVSVIASVVILVLYALQIVESDLLWLLVVTGFFFFLSLVGLWAYFREKFTLKDGVYTNSSLIKTQSCNAREVARVELQPTNGMWSYLIFIGKNGEQLMKCMDDGTTFRGGKFKKSLNHYGIKLEYK